MQRNALAYDYDLTLDQEPGDTIQWFNGVPVRLHKVGENVNLLKVWGGGEFLSLLGQGQEQHGLRRGAGLRPNRFSRCSESISPAAVWQKWPKPN